MPDTPEVPEGLRPANENPWYILMTLYGEQKGEMPDGELHEKNRRAWNAWAGQALSAEERADAAKSSGLEVAELDGWEALAEEIKTRFKAQYLRRNPEAGNVPDLPDPKDQIEMSETAFSNTVVLEKAVFASIARFTSATFAQDAIFTSATFTQTAWFDYATFTQKAIFTLATFTQHARFTSATFTQDAWFDSATFTKDAWFDSATFTQTAWFDYATFTQHARFDSATFTQTAWFGTATFTQTARFFSATFSGFAYFTKTRFGGAREKTCIPIFIDCQFEKPTSFRQALFMDEYPDFAGAVLHDKTSFTARMEPTSDEIYIDKELKGQTYWPKTTNQDPVSARESCATIRHVLTKQGLPEEAHFFFRREMHFAGLRSEGRSLAERLPYILFGWFSDYGYSIQRPLIWLLCLWAFGAAAFWGYLAGCCSPAPLEAVRHPLGTAMALSFSNLFPLFGFGRAFLGEVLRELPPVLKTLSGAQTVLSLPLLFFLGLGLRQRFRLR